MKPEKKPIKPTPLTKEDRERLAEVAKYCVGKDLFPEATAEAERIINRLVIHTVKK